MLLKKVGRMDVIAFKIIRRYYYSCIISGFLAKLNVKFAMTAVYIEGIRAHNYFNQTHKYFKCTLAKTGKIVAPMENKRSERKQNTLVRIE